MSDGGGHLFLQWGEFSVYDWGDPGRRGRLVAGFAMGDFPLHLQAEVPPLVFEVIDAAGGVTEFIDMFLDLIPQLAAPLVPAGGLCAERLRAVKSTEMFDHVLHQRLSLLVGEIGFPFPAGEGTRPQWLEQQSVLYLDGGDGRGGDGGGRGGNGGGGGLGSGDR